jgi:hypothetical protein
MATTWRQSRQTGTGLAVSIALVGVVVALIIAALIAAVDRDERDSREAARPAVLSYYVDGSGDGLVGGSGDLANVPPAVLDMEGQVEGRMSVTERPIARYEEGAGEGLIGGQAARDLQSPRAYPAENGGEGLIGGSGDLAVTRPTTRFKPFSGDVGLTAGGVTPAVILPEEATPADVAARQTIDDIQFREWNDPLGWQAIPAQPAVVSSTDILFWEQNVTSMIGYTETVKVAKVDPYARMRFLEMNTDLPGWSEGAKFAGNGRLPFTIY